MLSKEFVVFDGYSPLWLPARPLVDIALRFDLNDNTYTWCSWNRQQSSDFLDSLPSRTSLVAPVSWALCIEKTAWGDWLFLAEDNGIVVDKGQHLASFVHQGRCVLLGSQTIYHVKPF